MVFSMSVIEIKKHVRPEPDVWQCHCGSFTFWLYSNGSAYCSECREEAVSMFGHWELPERQPDSAEHIENIIQLFGDNSESN